MLLPEAVAAQRGLTLRSTGRTTACHPARDLPRHMLHLAGWVACRGAPVNSTLGVMNTASAASPSTLRAAPLVQAWVGALRRQQSAVGSRSISFSSYSSCGSSRPSPASARALRRQEGFFCAHVLRRSRELIAVTRFAHSACAAPRHLPPHAAGRVGLSSPHPVRLARRPAHAAIEALGHQGRQHRCYCQASARSTPGMPPNMPVNRSANGMAPGPRRARCPCCASRPRHHAVVARLPLR